jgi:cytochrome c-type biogenesis protein CcmH/NrfG
MLLGRPQQALKALLPAEFARRGEADYWEQRAQAGLALRRPELALQSFQSALRLEPRRIAALCGAAEALHQLKQTRDAERTLLRVLRIDPNHGPAWCLLARIWLEQKQTQDALVCLRYARSRGCDDVELDRLLARGFMSQGRITAAAAAFELLLRRLPQDSEAQLGRMRCRQELSNPRRSGAAAESTP